MFHRKPAVHPPVQTRVATDAMSNTSTFSMIGADVVINGDVSATADLHIDGRIQGDITCTSLVQGASSEMIGAIVAQSAHMAGTVRGSITVSDLVIQRSAHIIGDVNYEALTIEQGARVEGKFAKANAEAPVVIFDVPLLFETGGQRAMDKVVVVSAAPEVQRARTLQRPGMSEAKLDAILARQVPDADKRAQADFVIPTDVPIEETRSHVRRVIACLNEVEVR